MKDPDTDCLGRQEGFSEHFQTGLTESTRIQCSGGWIASV